MILPCNNPELADHILSCLAQICTEHDILYFISCGTCLGFYRDNDYIPDDNDLDASIIFSHEHFNILPALLYPYGIVADSHGKFEGRHFWKDDMLLDITWVKPEGFYKSHDEIGRNGIIYPAPHPIEEYLAWKYGSTWQVPMKEGYTLQHEPQR